MTKPVQIGEMATHPLSHNNIIERHYNEFGVAVSQPKPKFNYELPKDFPFNEVRIANSMSGSGNTQSGGQSGNKSSGMANTGS